MIRYRLRPAEATRRARWAALIPAAASLAPIALALVLARRVGWRPTTVFWAVAGVLAILVVLRGAVVYMRTNRKLRALLVTVGDNDIHVEALGRGYGIPRSHVARIVEITGSLGGLRVESVPDADSGIISEASVPRGGDGFAEVRGKLESWRPVERRGRRGPAMRAAIGAVVVAGIFFIPFFLEDFVARSRLLAAGLVAGMWLVMRTVTRG